MGGVNQLDRGFECLDRSQRRVSQAEYRADGGKPPQTVSRHPNLNWTVGRVPPAATGIGRFDRGRAMDCPELLKAGLPGRGQAVNIRRAIAPGD
ncbi:hypothetical protein [Microcoleus sp. K4-B3]|uniref:hypothetical protein n=1 Tax=Microcoleus sp. K4-B3 TaxID=2818791 RepID=UPI002FCEF090